MVCLSLKSSSLQFLPILGLVAGFRERPFLIALYAGRGNLRILRSIWEEYFVDEATRLKSEGMMYRHQRLYISVSAFICDAPARAYIRCVKSLSGYFACERCIQEKLYVWRMTFPDANSELRTNESFLEQQQEEHHTGVSPLVRLGMGISQFPLDLMHLLYPGVMKRLRHQWHSQGQKWC